MGQLFSQSGLSYIDQKNIIDALKSHDVPFIRGCHKFTSLYSKDGTFLAIVETFIVGDECHLRLTNKKGEFLGRRVSSIQFEISEGRRMNKF